MTMSTTWQCTRRNTRAVAGSLAPIPKNDEGYVYSGYFLFPLFLIHRTHFPLAPQSRLLRDCPSPLTSSQVYPLLLLPSLTAALLQKAAPPGRCHSCNRAETPEWRRGPDGARTLCNACGLHYAKLTRKMGANKASSLGSNLKPKTALDSASPSSH